MSINIKTKKFIFFDEVKESEDNNKAKTIENKKEEKKEIEKEKDNNENQEEILNFNLSSAVQIKGLQCLDEVLFLCGTVTEKIKKNKKIGLLKIFDNQLIDIYNMFNTYYDFQLIKYQDRPILILFGLMRKKEETL